MSGRKSGAPVAVATGIEHELPLDLHLRAESRVSNRELRRSKDGSWNASSPFAERRSTQRVAYHRPMLVTPLDDRTGQPAGGIMVTARDISLGGISFTHGDPLSCRSVVCNV